MDRVNGLNIIVEGVTSQGAPLSPNTRTTGRRYRREMADVTDVSAAVIIEDEYDNEYQHV